MNNTLDFYDSLDRQLAALLGGNRNMLTNLSQFSAFVNMHLPDINWVGFYLFDDNTLWLGPFQGKVACTTIPMGKGVCGTAAQTRHSVLVEDVDQFAGHIACDAASQSEIACPILVEDRLIGVLDVDSPILGRFTSKDVEGMEKLVKTLIDLTDF